MNARFNNGFTLIEVLVALAVFGVLSLLAYMTLGQTLSNADMLSVRMDRLQSIQRTISYLSSELLQTIPRSIRADLGDEPQPPLQSSLASEFALQLTHGGWPNSAGVPRILRGDPAEGPDVQEKQDEGEGDHHRLGGVRCQSGDCDAG